MAQEGAMRSGEWDEPSELTSQDEPVRTTTRRRSRRGVKSAKYRAMEKKLEKHRLSLWVMAGVVTVTLLGSYLYVDSRTLHTLKLQKQEQRQTEEIASLNKQLDLLRVENAQLVEGRIPNLRPLTTGNVLRKPAKFVKSLLFTKTNSADGDRYEYLMVLSNNAALPVTPQVDIHLFDATGVQVGGANVTKTETPLGRRKAQLITNESRSHSGELTFRSKEAPKYFLIETKEVGSSGKFVGRVH